MVLCTLMPFGQNLSLVSANFQIQDLYSLTICKAHVTPVHRASNLFPFDSVPQNNLKFFIALISVTSATPKGAHWRLLCSLYFVALACLHKFFPVTWIRQIRCHCSLLYCLILWCSVAFCIAREVDICSCMQLGQESLVELRTEIPRLGQVGQGLGSRLKDSGEIDTKKKKNRLTQLTDSYHSPRFTWRAAHTSQIQENK